MRIDPNPCIIYQKGILSGLENPGHFGLSSDSEGKLKLSNALFSDEMRSDANSEHSHRNRDQWVFLRIRNPNEMEIGLKIHTLEYSLK